MAVRRFKELVIIRRVWPCIPLLCILFVSAGECPDTTAMDRKLIKAGLSNVKKIDSVIQVNLKYSTANNAAQMDLYGDFCSCYLQKAAALKLAAAQRYLEKLRPGYSLLTYDCLRPRSIQKKVYTIVEGTDLQRYVANPNSGSMHNFGCAVDISIVDEFGRELDMGTEYDHFGDLAQPRHESRFLKQGKLKKNQVENRRLLRTVMKKAGFTGIMSEWWHFNAFSRKEIRKRYKIVE
ncbi:M15 family metallopeptidase [Fibrobacterota bacterium]